MSYISAPTRSAARGGTTRRRGACLAMGAALIAGSLAAADDPGRSGRTPAAAPPTAAVGDARTVRPQTGPVLRTFPDPRGARSVRSADWNETTDGSAARQSHRVTPVAGGGGVNTDSRPTVGQQRTPATVSGIAPAKFQVPAAEPLSRFSLPESSSEFDPGQTLRDWAEGAGLLVAFGVVALWLLRQWITRRDLPGGAMSHLRILESLALPQRGRIHLVEVDGRQVLVAADAAGIKSVTVLPDRFGQLLDVTEEDAGARVGATADLPEPTRVAAWHGLQDSRPA